MSRNRLVDGLTQAGQHVVVDHLARVDVHDRPEGDGVEGPTETNGEGVLPFLRADDVVEGLDLDVCHVAVVSEVDAVAGDPLEGEQVMGVLDLV